MKNKYIFTALTILSVSLFAPISHADDFTAVQSGLWGDTNTWIDNTSTNETVPGTNDDADIPSGINVTVNTNAYVQYVYDAGSVTMAPNSTFNVVGDPAGAEGTYLLGALNATATGNTVIYSGNPFWAMHTNYYNLIFSNTISTMNQDFFNGYVNAYDPSNAMTIAGNMTVIGLIKVQEGANITIGGNLVLDTNGAWDCSSFNLNLASNLYVGTGSLLLDLDAANGSNNINGNLTVSSGAEGWNVSDVTTWYLGENLTNNGLIVGKGFGSISFDGTGIITGSRPITIPTMTVNGTYEIGDTITLTTNTPTLNGTLVFDLANTNQIVLQAGAGTALYYSGDLDVINSGAPPVSGDSYQFFSCPNSYGGAFASETFPTLANGLSWVDNTLTSGSIAVTGAILGSPTLTLSRSGAVLTLSWNSTTYPGYSVQAQTNSAGIHSNWSPTGSGTVSPYTVTINPANPPVFFRLINP
jgi:hypothetical protein